MVEQTTNDGVTPEQIDAAYEVLEVLRENLSDREMENLSNIVNEAHYLVQQYEQTASWTVNWNVPDMFDVVQDTENIDRFGSGEVRVVGLPDASAREYRIDEIGDTVAGQNPDHPADAPVVLGRYVDGSEKVYAFPCTRLE